MWATGWEEKANEYLPWLLRLEERELPVLTFDGRAVFGSAHWKVEAIDQYAADRPAAWIDDNLDERCHMWARDRSAPSLLVETNAAVGISDEHVELLLEWAGRVTVPAAAEQSNGAGHAGPVVAAPDAPFEFHDRVRFADLDAYGQIAESAIFQFVEAARFAFLRQVGLGPGDVSLVRTEVDYRGGAIQGEEVIAQVWPTDVGAERIALHIDLRAGVTGRPLAEAVNVVMGPLAPGATDELRRRLPAA